MPAAHTPAAGRALVVYGPEAPSVPEMSELVLEGIPLRIAFGHVPPPTFDPKTQARSVLLRKIGFSLNYRDRVIALELALRAPAGSFMPLGSDFVAEVLACGDAVTELSPGDRVIPDSAYPDAGEPGAVAGIPVNTASREFQVLPAVKLMRIPATISDAVAASLTIGAQTAASIVRRVDPAPGSAVLVTSARSNTSLFVIAALRARAVRIHAATRSAADDERLRALGVSELVRSVPGPGGLPNFANAPACKRVLKEEGGYAAVIDPFVDLHLQAAVEVLGYFGKYISCGMADQHTGRTGGSRGPSLDPDFILTQMLNKGLCLIGNCLGLTEDLAGAVADCAAGRLEVIVDSVHHDESDAAAFLHRTWLAPDRFGKVAFLYQQ